jgi:hypothetical protein
VAAAVQGFRTKEEVQRFSDLMEEMCHIVANKHSGSLKGEHGTGRNVAPFVEMEWGSKAYELMWELKELFDPDYVLNPSEHQGTTRGGGPVRKGTIMIILAPIAMWMLTFAWRLQSAV